MISEAKRQYCEAATVNGCEETCVELEEPHAAESSSEIICEQHAVEKQTTSSFREKGNAGCTT